MGLCYIKNFRPICVLVILIFNTSVAASQNLETRLSEAIKLRKELKYEQSFNLFKQLLKADSANAVYLANTGFLYAKIGYSQPTEKQKTHYYTTASYLAKKAIAIDTNNAYAHYAYAFALGRLNENAGTRQKIANAKRIKSECEKALHLDASLGGCHHILGRWHRTVAGFSFVEKLAINSLFGGVPQGGSYDEAITEFQKAIVLEPHYILHYYELALTYYERNKAGDKSYANVWAAKALELAPNPFDADDLSTRNNCSELLLQLK